MKEQRFNRPVPPLQPNFDDERTLLSARRVVPLEKIDAKQRRSRRWVLGGAFAVAMLLGAASALLASYLKLRNVPAATAEMSEVETPSAPMPIIGEVVANELPMTEDTAAAEDTEEVTTSVAPRRASRRRATVKPDPIPETRGMDEDEALDRIRESVLIDVWQERRARRAARRERRNRADHHDRDLSNIDEIFQGPRRPRP